MSPQMFELIVLAGIALFVINRLISVLGSTDEGESEGERGMRDVTNTGHDWTVQPKDDGKYDTLLVDSTNATLKDNLREVCQKVDNFDPEVFLENTIQARGMILDAVKQQDDLALNQLVDKRYQEKLCQLARTITFGVQGAKISDIFFFGNSIIVRVRFDGSTVQEWSFSRNVSHSGPDWYLSNIEDL